MLVYLIIIPLLVVLLVNLPFRKEFMNIAAFWLALLFSVAEFFLILMPNYTGWAATSKLSEFLKLTITPDSISSVMFVAIGAVAGTALMVSRYWIQRRDRQFLFTNLLLLSVAGMNGIVLTTDLFTLYVFLELTAVSSFILIAFDLEKTGFEGAFKYLVLSALATTLILTGIAVLFMITGGTSFLSVAIALKGNSTNGLVLLGLASFVVGLSIKGGLVPFHGWVPDAYMSAPAPTSVLLAGMVTKASGIYTLIRLGTSVFTIEGPIQLTLLALGLISLIAGALLALVQSDFKRMLAYSSISQVGYIILGLGAASPLGTAGAVFHLFNHSIFKTLLFVNASVVEKETGTRVMDELGGLSNQMPITGATSVVGLLSTAGIPPLSGFWSKLMIIIAVWKAGFSTAAIIAIIMSLVTLAYFLSMQRRVFFGKTAPEFADVKEADAWATIPEVVLAVITIGLGLAFPWLFQSFLVPVGSFL